MRVILYPISMISAVCLILAACGDPSFETAGSEQAEAARTLMARGWSGIPSDVRASLTVEEPGWRGAFVGAVRKIRFPDSGERKVYVAPEALVLDGEDFQAAVSSLDPVELVNRLREHPHRVARIWPDGKVKDLN